MTTAQPSTSSEWQLYRVLQKANLLQYYDTFVAQGGDDVQQLCEAGEEEFLEIMALVGMASKPLHVRRLQKSLQEWVANPSSFQGPGSSASPSSVSSLLNTPVREPPTQVCSLPNTSAATATDSGGNMWLSAALKNGSPENIVQEKLSSSPVPNPVLTEAQINLIAQSAARLVPSLPYFEAKRLSLKKDINREIYAILEMPKEGPERLELMRKYGCIYGRHDSKRKNDRPMSLHEISVNEAASQLCFHLPNLLTRREDLFPLAREVVKHSGYQYSKGHSRATEFNPTNPCKKLKLDIPGFGDASPFMKAAKVEMERQIREDRLAAINKEIAHVSSRQEDVLQQLENAKESSDNDNVTELQSSLEKITNRHLQLLTEQSDLLRKQSLFSDYLSDMEKDDSNAPSGSSSPTQSRDNSTLKSMLAAASANNAFPTPNSLFDEGLRIAQQYGMADFAEEIQHLKEDNPNDELSSSKNSNNDSLNQSVDNDLSESANNSSSTPVKAKDESTDSQFALEGVKIEMNGD